MLSTKNATEQGRIRTLVVYQALSLLFNRVGSEHLLHANVVLQRLCLGDTLAVALCNVCLDPCGIGTCCYHGRQRLAHGLTNHHGVLHRWALRCCIAWKYCTCTAWQLAKVYCMGASRRCIAWGYHRGILHGSSLEAYCME